MLRKIKTEVALGGKQNINPTQHKKGLHLKIQSITMYCVLRGPCTVIKLTDPTVNHRDWHESHWV